MQNILFHLIVVIGTQIHSFNAFILAQVLPRRLNVWYRALINGKDERFD